MRRDKRSGFLILFFRTIDNRPYGSFNIYEVVSFVRHPVGTSIARPILLIIKYLQNLSNMIQYFRATAPGAIITDMWFALLFLEGVRFCPLSILQGGR